MAGSSDAQLQIKLVTKQSTYAVPDIPYSVPSEIVCGELNSLVNELLTETHGGAVVEFDFLVGGELLRTHLSEHLSERQVSAEEVVLVEYVERFPAPEPQDCLEHDDWVSATQASGEWILSGSYDSTLHLWSRKGTHLLTIPGHTGAVKAVAWVETADKICSFVSASQDQTAMIWQWNQTSNSVECVHVLRGHDRGLECLAVDPTRTYIATAGWDKVIHLWSTVEGLSEGESFPKKIKFDSKSPLMSFQGHKEAISAVQWSEEGEMISASWDHTIKTWDAELGGIKVEIVGNKSFFDLSWSPLTRTAITASADRHVRLYDPRSTEGTLVKSTFTSHTEWVQCVKWSTTSEYHFISGSYDKQVKLWDTRSPKAPLFDMSGHQDKVLCCDWSNPELILSGSSDNSLRIFKSQHVL
ncbi:ribosome biogenesis protein WDR12 homolog isoform X2 [Neocloeon triangulifer]|uniref:ribosome biogenesis protein WDR12 homolog isoform X2 n=1 Tax=Neocloeon triangulifer TaxID=2078957 RepID=UPI00286EBBC4|nr:ribosome biogenesis protein WDR12 homolog isoform X2 [Neocloeon triangulifer]